MQFADLNFSVCFETQQYKVHHANERPKKLLLGQLQLTILREVVPSSIMYFPEEPFPGTGDNRLEFQGMKVYAVDDENYIAVIK